MIDTHVHLDDDSFDNDRDEVIARFFRMKSALRSSARRSEVGVVSKSLGEGGSESGKKESHEYKRKALVAIGVDKESNKQVLKIARAQKNVFCALGFHPTDEKGASVKFGDEDCRELQKKLGSEKVVAVGEIGLDYFWDKTGKGKNTQKETFMKQLKIADKFELPVVVHCRDAYADLYKILNSKFKIQNSKFVIHCYGGSVEDTRRFLELENVHFSFTGNITFTKSEQAKIFRVIRMIPLERIMIETDSPLLAPVPHRGERNEPRYVKYVLEKLAHIKGIKINKSEEATDQNAINFFNLHLQQ